MTPKITNAISGEVIAFAEFDNMICKAFEKDSSKVGFSEEYLMFMDIADVIYTNGKWSNTIFENILARLEVACQNNVYMEKFKMNALYFLRDAYIYVPSPSDD